MKYETQHICPWYRMQFCWVSFMFIFVYAVSQISRLCRVPLSWESLCWVSWRHQQPHLDQQSINQQSTGWVYIWPSYQNLLLKASLLPSQVYRSLYNKSLLIRNLQKMNKIESKLVFLLLSVTFTGLGKHTSLIRNPYIKNP